MTLIERYKSGEPPIDVRLTLTARGRHEATLDELLAENARLDAAIAAGQHEPLRFNDFRWVENGKVYTDPDHPDLIGTETI